ncbi:hypothetical protein ACWIGN_19515, partial [Streptomyces albidoflavus]
AAPRGFVQRVVRGRPEDPRWARPALLALLVVTAALYLWDLSASKYANQFYSAAVARVSCPRGRRRDARRSRGRPS